MRFQVAFYRDGDTAANVEVDAASEEDAVTMALASGQVARLLDGPWTATVDPVREK